MLRMSLLMIFHLMLVGYDGDLALTFEDGWMHTRYHVMLSLMYIVLCEERLRICFTYLLVGCKTNFLFLIPKLRVSADTENRFDNSARFSQNFTAISHNP